MFAERSDENKSRSQEIKRNRKGNEEMKITLKDGSCKEYQQPMSVYEIAAGYQRRTWPEWRQPENWNGEIVDLRTVIDQDCASEYPDI